MEFKALEGLGTRRFLGKTSKKVQDTPKEPAPPAIVRIPRVVPAAKAPAVDRVKDAEDTKGAIVATGKLGLAQITQERREFVLSWMLNGHQFADELMTVAQLADALGVNRKVIEKDIVALKEKMAEWHIDGDQKDVASLAYMLMEMKFQDRGRALVLYNTILADIQAEDEAAATILKENGKPPKTRLTGRDRAAMYNSALAAMDLANRSTNGMESLLKLTGGAKKLQQIINARQLTINQNNMSVSLDTLYKFVSNSLAGVLPSARKVDPQLPAPPTIELTEDEVEIMKIGAK